jgi:uncharacterized oligopeptide transporter (OPT) family protein
MSEPTAPPEAAPESAAPESQDADRLYFPPPEEQGFSIRAVLAGCLLGGLVSAMNIYLGLRIGWSFGGSLIAAILGFSIFFVLARTGLVKKHFGVLEANITQTAGSAAGSMTSAAGLLAPIPAMRMLGYEFTYVELTVWAFSVAYLGVFFAVPLRRQMVLVEKLRFPTGTATAQTIMAMVTGGGEALGKAKALLWFGVIAAAFTLATYFVPEMEMPPTGFIDKGLAAMGLTISLGYLGAWGFALLISPMMTGAGILIGPRVGVSLLLGAIAGWWILGHFVVDQGWACGVLPSGSTGGYQPCYTDAALAKFNADKVGLLSQLSWLHSQGDVPGDVALNRAFAVDGLHKSWMKAAWHHKGVNDYQVGVKGWILWPGVAIMVADSLTSLALSWRTILNTFMPKKKEDLGEALPDLGADKQIPNAWWIGGLALASMTTVGATYFLFDIPPLLALLGIGLSAVLSMIAVRSTGETDINPIGGMGKVTQLVFGALAPGAITTNLMAAAVTGSGASQAGDMMQDLKTGYMLGASPRAQFKAQLIGIAFGIAFCVPIFLLFDSAYEIGGADLPAPAAHAWKAVAELLAKGPEALPPNAEWAVLGGLAFGALLPVLRKFLPAKAKDYVPSALAFGIAMIVGAYYSIAMFLGALVFVIWKKLKPEQAAALSFAVASGLVAGEGLAGIGKAALVLLEVPTLAALLGG